MPAEPHPDPLASVIAAYTMVFGDPPVHGARTAPDDTAEWDSLAHIRLVYAIEQDLDVVLPEELLTAGPCLADLAEAAGAAMAARSR